MNENQKDFIFKTLAMLLVLFVYFGTITIWFLNKYIGIITITIILIGIWFTILFKKGE